MRLSEALACAITALFWINPGQSSSSYEYDDALTEWDLLYDLSRGDTGTPRLGKVWTRVATQRQRPVNGSLL